MRRPVRPALAFAALAALSAASLLFLEGTPFLHVRFLSAIYLFVLFAFLCAVRALAPPPPLQWAAAAPLGLLVLQSLVPSADLDASLPGFARHPARDAAAWWRWNLSGIEAKYEAEHVLGAWEYLASLDGDDGRVAFEYGDYNSYGSPRIFELTPYMSGRDVTEGLLLESSVNYGALFYIGKLFNPGTWWPGFPVEMPEIDVARGIRYYGRYHVKYFVANREPTREAMEALGYPSLYRNPGFEVFAVNEESRIAARIEGGVPVVHAPHPALESVLQLPASLETVVEVRPGPSRPGESLTDVAVPEQTFVPLPGRWSEDGQAYTVEETGASAGRPADVLVKIAYFPNWRTDTGEAVRLVTPNLILVRTEHPRLRLRFTPGRPERLSLLVSGASLILLAGVPLRKRLAARWESGT